jgi:hypothetical protein
MRLTIMDEQAYGMAGFPIEGVKDLQGWGHVIHYDDATVVPRVGDSVDWPPVETELAARDLVTWEPGFSPIIKRVVWIPGPKDSPSLRVIAIVGMGHA